MCGPAALIGTALSVGGQIVNGMEANANNTRIINARNAATNAELARQKQYQDQATGIFDTGLGAFSPGTQDARLTAAKGDANSFFASNAPTQPAVGTLGFGDAGAASKAAEAHAVADALSRGTARTKALADLTGWDQLGFQNRVGLNDTTRQLGTISNLAGNSASVSGLEREVAGENAYRPSSGLGDLLGFAGNVVGGGNLNFGGGAATTLPTSAGLRWDSAFGPARAF